MAATKRPLLSGLPKLTVRGWMLLAGSAVAIIVAYDVGWQELLYVGLTLAVLVVASLLIVSARAARLEVSRRIAPDPVAAGGEVRVLLEVANTGWLPTGVSQWRDGAPRHAGSGGFRRLDSIAVRGRSDGRIRVSYDMSVPERGRFSIGPLYVRASDAFGVCRHERPMGEADELLVLPQIVGLDGAVSAPVALSDAALRAALAGRGQDDVIAREYRSGDALRHVHWRATAHRGELMVRQEQGHDDAQAIVVLDNAREHWQNASAFEWAVSFAASAIVHLASHGTGVSLVLTVPTVGEPAVFESPREALVALATVSRHSARRGAAANPLDGLLHDGPAPLFVVAGSMSPAEWRDFATVRSPQAHASAVIVDAGGVPDALWAAGWQCAPVDDPDADMAATWQSVTTGAARV